MSGGPASGKLSGRAVLMCLLGFFALVVLVNVIMIRLAVSTFGGIETENSYQAGLAYVNAIAAAQAQEALHWRVDAEIARNGRSTRIDLAVRDAEDQPVSGLAAAGRLMHPTDSRSDRVISFSERAPGQLQGASEADSGQWTLLIELSRAGTRLFQSRNRVFLR